MSELEMATTTELIAELKKRMSSFLLMGMSTIGMDPEESHGRLFALCSGNPFEVLGMAVKAQEMADDYLHDNVGLSSEDE